MTIVTWGSQVQKSIESARNTSVSIEIIDIPTALLIPWILPARLYAKGTILEIPKPKILNPITENIIEFDKKITSMILAFLKHVLPNTIILNLLK